LFPGTDLTGSEHNDEFYMDEAGNVRTRTNRSGGVQVFILVRYLLRRSFSLLVVRIMLLIPRKKKKVTDCLLYVHAGRDIKW
jgi:hypothetical protein